MEGFDPMATSPTIPRRTALGALLALPAASALSACGAPGSGPATTAPRSIGTELPAEPTTLTMRANADQAPLWEALGGAFEHAHPQITVEVVTEDFAALQQNGPRYLSSQDAPDLLRFPSPGDAVADGLLLPLQPYADAYGWNDFPETQLNQWRIAPDGHTRGDGDLYGLGIGFALVGLYTNTTALDGLGLALPESLEAMAEAMAAAKDAGLTPLVSSQAGLSYILQNLMQATAAEQVSDWVLGRSGASIEGPETEAAAAALLDWRDRGFLAPDVLAVDDTAALSAFTAGQGLFYIQGSWMAAAVDQAATGIEVRFTVVPGTAPDSAPTATSAPNGFVIPANAQHPDVAAAFLHWASTDPEARDLLVATAGLLPGGPVEPAPALDEDGTLADAAAAFTAVSEADRFVDFLANASAGMLTGTLQPQIDLLIDGQSDPATFLSRLQEDVERERA
nr:extracellular solute-binding protein [Glycomyces mayteni]